MHIASGTFILTTGVQQMMDRKGVDSRKWANALPVMRYPIQATITNPSSEDDQGANERHHQTILTV